MEPLSATDPRQIGRYRVLGLLGAGGMGKVYLGRSPGGRPVAIKVIREEHSEDEQFRMRFAREIDAATAVSGAFTAAVIEAAPNARPPWLVTSYIEGPSLLKAVSDFGPFPESSLRVLTAGLAEALREIHQSGLIHRDVKPTNVLLASDGPRVIDFGIAWAAEAVSLTQVGTHFGTPGFMAPEQAVGERVTASSDMFSLGCVIVFAATGVSPFGEGNSTALLYRVVHNEPTLDGLPPSLRDVVGACLAKNPVHRPRPDQILAQIDTGFDHAWLPAQVTTVLAQKSAETRAMLDGTRVRPTGTAGDPAQASPARNGPGHPRTRLLAGIPIPTSYPAEAVEQPPPYETEQPPPKYQPEPVGFAEPYSAGDPRHVEAAAAPRSEPHAEPHSGPYADPYVAERAPVRRPEVSRRAEAPRARRPAQRQTIAPQPEPRYEEPAPRRYADDGDGRGLLGRILLAPFAAVGYLLKGIVAVLLWPFKALWSCLLITVIAVGVIVFFSMDAISGMSDLIDRTFDMLRSLFDFL
ncbi:serine/threonine protein kinase [Actinoalloteichus hoggarensis]|uniref:Serine/threonine-protein kinase AfsK n=2 Tax=Actinoalloteichus hoggarensis TaxID=1470176 RepID=A0A221VY08_9PSEU|nr:serine/threonine-protein kinase [Actinoalloteichus hoggarensis]ASO18131.1 Serine/threonine-protein kinase AfsK [Actinoalloteichus hoggarensis]MBB5921487.1 serine/threonine protein kinase [Actinoalloteichus hoggarensis]